jgi:probable selenium-dependent hydroxylase accessory protein YqeC
MLTEALGLADARVIAFCGAGGKTTLMFTLARELAAAGERVLICPTTKIAREEARGWNAFQADSLDRIYEETRRRQLPRKQILICYRETTADDAKLVGHLPETVDRLKEGREIDRILVEADGAARRPLKAPAAHEPVVPASADAVICVAGANGLGSLLSEENVFRAEIWARLTGAPIGAPVTAESLVRMALHHAGMAKGCPAQARAILFLNQARAAQAARIMHALATSANNPFERLASGWLLPAPHITVATLAQKSPKTGTDHDLLPATIVSQRL